MPKKRLKTGLVLSGGGSAGAAQVGALKVISKKITPDIYIGTSVGSINAAALAHGISVEEIEDIWLKLKKRDIFSFNPRIIFPLGKILSLYSNRGLRKVLKRYMPERFEDLKYPLYINATDLETNQSEYFSKGSLIDAILASSAVPPFLPPHKIKGVRYIDGGISDLLGVQQAEKLGCKQLIIVNSYAQGPPGNLMSWIGLTTHSLSTIISLKSKMEAVCEAAMYPKKRVIYIQPNIKKHVSIVDFSYTRELIEAGEKAALKEASKICSPKNCPPKKKLLQ